MTTYLLKLRVFREVEVVVAAPSPEAASRWAREHGADFLEYGVDPADGVYEGPATCTSVVEYRDDAQPDVQVDTEGKELKEEGA